MNNKELGTYRDPLGEQIGEAVSESLNPTIIASEAIEYARNWPREVALSIVVLNPTTIKTLDIANQAGMQDGGPLSRIKEIITDSLDSLYETTGATPELFQGVFVGLAVIGTTCILIEKVSQRRK